MSATLPSPPHLPRWSKTAAIVVLLVFSLVVVVALFGLWAFKERRDADAERSHTSKLDLAGRMLDEVHGAVRTSLSDVLRQSAAAEDTKALWRVLSAEGSLVRQMCRYAGVEVFWIDNQFLLHLPDKALTVWANQQGQRVEEAIAEANRLEALQGDLLSRLEAWTAHVRDFPVVSKTIPGEELRYPTSLKDVTVMLEVALRVPIDSAPSALRDAMLAALMAEGLNRTRADLAPGDRDQLLGQIRKSLTALREKLPLDQPPYVRWEVEQFEALRDILADPDRRRPLENAIRAAKGPGSRPKPGQVYLHYAEPDIVAVVAGSELLPGMTQPMLTALHLNFDALRNLVAAQIRSPRWATSGIDLQLRTDAANSPLFLMDKQLVDLQAHWDLPLTVVADDEPMPLFGTATDWFYWGIIALACLGIAIGGWVLVRLLTRQVRLAELKADFVSNLSHELKTPITSIGLFAEMLQDGKLRSEEDRVEAYEVIAQETERLKHTVARMLGIARRAASSSPYRMQPGDLNVPTRRAVERFQRLVTDPGLTLAIELSPGPLPMTLDVAALEDVVTNLLTNAWKYRRGESARVRIRTVRRRGKGVLEVADDGVGVPRSERRRIFQMFYRSEQLLSQGVAGTGLGLALVRTVVRGHRGRIRVLDGLGGRGSTFEAIFPLDTHDPEVTDRTSAPQSEGQTRVSNKSADRRSKQPSEHRRSSGSAAEHQ